MAVARLTVSRPATEAAPPNLSDEVELYQRTYTTLLRSSGETRLRVLEPSHMAMGSSLHPLADSRRDRPRRLHLRHPPPARRGCCARDRRHGPGSRAVRARAGRPARAVGGRRGARPPTALVRQRRRGARRPAGHRSPTSTTSSRRSSPSRSSGTRSAARMLRRRLAAAARASRPRPARRRWAARPTTGRACADAWGEHFEERMQAIADAVQVDAPAACSAARRSATSA